MDGASYGGRSPRPVPETPRLDGAGVAKAWLLALVADAPLERAGAVPAAELARSGPALCDAVVAALSSDADLERLLEGGERPSLASLAGRLTGAASASATAAGVEALRRVLWRAARDELRDPAPEVVGELADRLAYVCSRVVAASLSVPLPRAGAARTGPGADVADGVTPLDARADAEPSAPPNGVHVVDMPADPRPVNDPLTTLAEELAAAPPTGVAGQAPGIGFAPSPEAVTIRRVRVERPVVAEDEYAGPPWLVAISRRLERRAIDGLPFAVLVAEVDDLDRLLAAQSGRELAFALEAAERGLTTELSPADLVVRERLGRWWITSPDHDVVGGRDLATRVAAAIGRAILAGVPLTASIGVAACPEHGEDVEALASQADESMFVARAAGVPLA